jgi:hypothetical protein
MSRRSGQLPTTKSLGAIGALVCAASVVIQSPVLLTSTPASRLTTYDHHEP